MRRPGLLGEGDGAVSPGDLQLVLEGLARVWYVALVGPSWVSLLTETVKVKLHAPLSPRASLHRARRPVAALGQTRPRRDRPGRGDPELRGSRRLAVGDGAMGAGDLELGREGGPTCSPGGARGDLRRASWR